MVFFDSKGVRQCLALLLGCVAIAACSTAPLAPQTLSAAQISAIVASPSRSAADRNNDLRRKPEAMLAFIGIQPGMQALDISSGGGYTTELLARAIGPSGTVYGQSRSRAAQGVAQTSAVPEGNSNPALAPAPVSAFRGTPQALAERSQKLQAAGVAAAPMVSVVQPFENPVPAAVAMGGLDVVTLMFNYHDLGHMGVDRARMNAAVFQALKPGGMYVIADHAGRTGTGISEAGTLHRIEEAFLRREVEAAGFKLVAQGDFLRNPNDPRDRNTPEPPQPKDEFVLKFVKP